MPSSQPDADALRVWPETARSARVCPACNRLVMPGEPSIKESVAIVFDGPRPPRARERRSTVYHPQCHAERGSA